RLRLHVRGRRGGARPASPRQQAGAAGEAGRLGRQLRRARARDRDGAPHVRRVPLLSGSRVAVVEVPEGGVVLRPPPPGYEIDDVPAAVREALRYPLLGEPLEELVTRGGTATLVIEPPSLPIPS